VYKEEPVEIPKNNFAVRKKAVKLKQMIKAILWLTKQFQQ